MSPSSDAPIRTCIGCRARRPQRELVRYVAHEGVLTIGRGPGRGVYTCHDERCIARARGRFARHLRVAVVIPPGLGGASPKTVDW